MFTRKTVVTTTGNFSSKKISKAFGGLMDKGMEMLDKATEMLDEMFYESEEPEIVTTTIRIRLTPQQISDLQAKRPLTFRADGTTIRLEVGN
jgi:Golgi nucleoside diphosphatase